MIKIRRTLTLLIVLFIILSNLSIADTREYDDSIHESNRERFGRDSREIYYEDKVIVYPRNEFEGDIQKNMTELEEMMKRKETFSYEQSAYKNLYKHMYYSAPSYEGYSKEHMIYAMLFNRISHDLDPREIKDYCDDTTKFADLMIAKLKEGGDLQNVCKQIEENEAKCAEFSAKDCQQIGMPIVREDASEVEKINSRAYSCPVDKGVIVLACKRRNEFNIKSRLANAVDTCTKRFDFEGERLQKECDEFKRNQICSKDAYINQCLENFGVKKEDFGKSCTKEECDPAPGMPNYICPDGKTYAGPTCQRDASGKCGWQIISCPSTQTCKETDNGYDIFVRGMTYPPDTDYGKNDVCVNEKTLVEYGCNSDGSYGGDRQYNCDYGCKEGVCLSTANVACPQDVHQCPDGSFVKRISPSCDFEQCPTIKCPEPVIPSCATDTTLQKRVDDKGCTYYYCETTETTSNTTSITGYTVFNTYDDYTKRCETLWLEQQRICLQMSPSCDKETFIENCQKQERKNYDDFVLKMQPHCESETIAEVRYAEQRCNRIEEDRKHCIEVSMKRCEHMKGLTQQCRELVTEERIRSFIVDETKKRCKFTDIIDDEDDVLKAEKVEIVLAVLNTATQDDIGKLELFIDELHEDLKLEDTTVYKGVIEPHNFGDVKLLPFVVNAKISTTVSSERAKEVKTKIVSGEKFKEAASKLISLRDSDVPSEYLYIIEDKASEVLNVSEDLHEIGQKELEKGFFYKISLFLGIAKKAEQEEIKKLGENKERLETSITTLTKLIDEIPSDVAKAILKEQVENLQQQSEDIGVLIEAKQKKAKGLLGLFG